MLINTCVPTTCTDFIPKLLTYGCSFVALSRATAVPAPWLRFHGAHPSVVLLLALSPFSSGFLQSPLDGTDQSVRIGPETVMADIERVFLFTN